MWTPRAETVRAPAAGRPRWERRYQVDANAHRPGRPVASLGTTLDRFGSDTIIGQSPKFVAAIDAAQMVAATATTVLLTGESCTGKEVLARAIHHASARADGPFVALNCAALPETLAESELFGHERGAFTGADRQKPGRFELAAGGTLFLDEIGEPTPAVQAKLLRVLQERQYERVGGTTTLQADIRLIAATNRDLECGVADGRFREYYRLAVFRIDLPTLRERGEDVLLLAAHFMRELGAKMERQPPGLSGEARELLLAHSWPGNLRELQNAIERALILTKGALISPEHLGIVSRPVRDAAIRSVTVPPTENPTIMLAATGEAPDRRGAPAHARPHKTRAAALLGLTRFQLYARLKRYHIEEMGCNRLPGKTNRGALPPPD